MEDIFQERLIRQGNQNISDNVGVNPDQQLADTDKANALGVRVTDYQGNRDSYDARAAQTSTNLYAAGPVLQKFYANREKQLLIANDLPEFDRLDFTEKVFSTLKQGWNQFGVNVETEDAIDAARRFKDPLGTFMSENQGEGELENAWAQIPDRIRNAFSDKLQLDSLKQLQKEAEDLAVANRFAQVVKPPKVLERWENAKGWDQASEAFWSDPLSMIGYVGGTSLAQQFVPMLMSMPAFAFSPLAGAAASGAGSAYTEYLSSFAEKMSESGVNLTDRDAIVQFMLDPTKFAEAQEFASQRAGGVGLWDAVGGLVAATPFRFVAGTRGFGRQVSRALRGRHTAPLQRTKIARAIDRIADNSPIMSKFDAILSQTTVGGFLGGVGEFTAQMASGQETNWGDIFLEAIGEFFTMPAEIASAQTGIAMSKAKEFRHVQVAKKASKLVTDLAKVASISNLRGRKPEVFKETIKEMGENSQLKEVYVRGSDISNELGQSILEVAPELGAALEEARKTGGDLVIPMDILLGSLSDDMKIINGIKDHIRISQDGMSVAEADAWVAENRDFMNRHFDAVFNAQIQKEEYRKELQTAVDPMAAQLNVALRETMAKRYAETGLMTEADAIKRADEVTTHSMRLFGAQLARVSTLLGMTPKQFMERYPNQVQYLYESLAADAESGALGQRVSPAKFSDAAINKGLAEDHRYTRKYASIEDMKRSEKSFSINLSVMESIPGMKGAIKRLRNPEKKTEAIIERMVDNLLWIYNQMPEEVRNRARLWYEGGHKSVILWANRYGIKPRQTAAILAVFSPRNNWFNNFTNAERTMDIYFSDARDFKPDDKLKAKLKELCAGKDEFRYSIAENKSLDEILKTDDLRTAAIWIRAYDEVFHDQRVRVQTPEGGVGNDWYRTERGTLKKCTWMDYHPIIKALSILRDGSMANIDAQLGDEFKVRDFYNNLYDPTDAQAMTIDTHQVGANLLSVMSSKSREVEQNFGGTGASSSAETGQRGTYAFYAEALSRAAERCGVMPREMQSISWEGIRVLFEDTKKKALRPKIEAIWKRHDKGEITVDQARQEILEVAGGFSKYQWEDTPFNDVPKPSYERGDVNLVHREEVVPEPVLAIEAAPDPRNAEAVAKWDELTADEKYMVTKNVVAYVLDRVALATKTRISEVGLQVGGWLGDVNFSATAEIADGGDAVGVAKLVARLLHQQAVMVISGTKQEGMFDSKVIEIKLPDGMTPTQIGDFYKTYIDSVKNEDGKSMVMDMSTANGIMRIVLDEGDDSAKILDALSKSIEGYPGTDGFIDISVSDAFVSFASGEDANGESTNSQGTSEGLAASRNDHYDSLQSEVDQFFNGQIERAKEARAQSSAGKQEAGNRVGHSLERGNAREWVGGLIHDNAELNQLIGEKGVKNFNEQAYIALAEAERLEGLGFSPAFVLRKTGWQRGFDNLWRYEIPDLQVPKSFFELKEDDGLKLKDFPGTEALVSAYPSLGDVRIVIRNDISKTHNGIFHPGTREIHINKELIELKVKNKKLQGPIEEAIRRTVVHEVQHAIQTLEGFARGTSPKEQRKPILDLLKAIGLKENAYREEWDTDGQALLDFIENPGASDVSQKIVEVLTKHGYKSKKEFVIDNLPFNRYWKTKGEAESRVVSERLGLTEDSRRHTLLKTSLKDVDAGSLIFAVEGLNKFEESLAQESQNEKRRAAYNPSEGVTRLFKMADESSFIHESAHYWLNTLALICGDIVDIPADQRTAGEQELLEILDGFLKWAGLDAKQQQPKSKLAQKIFNDLGIAGDSPEARIRIWNSMTLDQQRQFHEQFARGYEAYLRNGKAPTSALGRAFAKFKEWLLEIYKDASELDVEMTPEVYALYDRLFMSEMETKAETEGRHIIPLFTSAKAAGMSDDEFAKLKQAYDTVTEAIGASIRAGRERNHKLLASRVEREKLGLEKEFNDMIAQARKELEKSAVYRAWSMLDEGTTIEGIDFHSKLSRAEVTKILKGDTALIDALEAKGFLTDEASNFVPAKILADFAGARSAKQLVTDLAEMQPIEEEATEIAETRFMQQYGNLPNDEGLTRSAVVAVAAHDPSYSKALAYEYNALAKLTGSAKLAREGASKFAREKIGQQKVSQLRPLAHARAEARAGKDAERAFRSGDLVGAAIHKRNQVVQHHIAKAGYDALTEIQRGIKFVKRALKSKSIYGSYMVQIENLAARFGLANVEYNRGSKQLGEFLTEEEFPAGMVAEFLETDSTAMPYEQMTVEDFRELMDAIKMLVKTGREKNTVIIEGRRQSLKETVDSVKVSIENNATKQKRDFETRYQKSKPGDLTKQSVLRFIHSHMKIASWARIMDGDKLGAMWNTFIRRANECGDRETELRHQLTKQLQEIFDPLLRQGGMHSEEVVLPTANRPLTRQERIAFALNWGNDGNRQRLKDGFGIGDQEADVILRSLSESEWRAVEQIWAVFEGLRPEMEALEVRLYGRPPRWIEYSPFDVVTSEGKTITVSGGYYPAVYDFDADERANKHEDMKQAESLMHKAARAVATDRSHMKKRAAHVERPISLLLSNCFDALNNEVHDLCWREYVIDAQRLLKGGVSEQIRGYYGADVARDFQKWLQDVALGEQRPREGCEAWLSTLRQGVGLAGLGFNVVSAISQFTGLLSTTSRLGAYTGVGLGQYVRNPIEATRQVCEQSLFMKNRGLTRFRELNEVNNRIRNSENRIEQTMDWMRTGGYWMLLKIQQIVDTITWLGAYQRAIDNNHTVEEARAMADQEVIDTQGSGMIKDQASVERGGPAMKMLTVFYSFMNTAYNLNMTAFYGDRNRYRATAKILTMTMVMPVIEGMLRGALPVDISDDDDDDDITAKMMKQGAQVLNFNMGMLLGVRELAALSNVVSGEPIWSYQGPGGFRLIGDIYKATQQVAQGEYDAALVKSMVNLGGSMFGLPSAQINRVVSATTEDKVDTDAEFVRGALFGVKKH